MNNHPEEKIVVEDDYNHGQPSLPSGYTVTQVVQLFDAGYDLEEVADRLDVPEHEVKAATAYYRRNQEVIDRLLKEKLGAAVKYRTENN